MNTDEPNVELSIVDQFDPETTAMLQAFYSRSHVRIKERLDSLGTDQKEIKESLKKYYVGYGHKSIGQCASTTIFIEGVSILAAKAFQDSPLYNGQETSTRFIDFSKATIHNPLNDTTNIQKNWLDFYANSLSKVIEHVAKQRSLDLTDVTHYSAAKARAFDILRAFVPAGASTQLSWFTSFTHASDRLIQLSFHPLKEVGDVSVALSGYLQTQYPYAFSGFDSTLKKFSSYYYDNALGLNYLVMSQDEECFWPEYKIQKFEQSVVRTTDGMDRIQGVSVPRHFQYQGRIQVQYKLDYGSFRDIQRHRACVQMMPVLTTRLGFNEWYLNALPDDLHDEAIELILNQEELINTLYANNPDTDVQYYIPLGYNVTGLLDMDYPEAVYIAELRTSKTVHPTLRKLAISIAKDVEPYGFVNTFCDYSEDDFTIRRGQQDIIKTL